MLVLNELFAVNIGFKISNFNEFVDSEHVKAVKLPKQIYFNAANTNKNIMCAGKSVWLVLKVFVNCVHVLARTVNPVIFLCDCLLGSVTVDFNRKFVLWTSISLQVSSQEQESLNVQFAPNGTKDLCI